MFPAIQFQNINYFSKIEGAEWFTGGQFGPEGSIQATVFLFHCDNNSIDFEP
ncbi:hypothetical protein [Candidatus Brachybacter algidus]|uniref:hypothetical protein n=1 Tax=Candidatus Brachybacter algidus TaxID=2982024 RepID=UPI002580262B|nr:hypothetical protein [Candidatus Brachybacter algidus]